MITGTISSKGQVTIPKKIREFLKVGQSDQIVFKQVDDGKVVITCKHTPSNALFGLFKHKKPASPVSIKEMERVIQKKRGVRGLR